VGITQYQLYRRLGGPNSQYKWVQKILLLMGFDPQNAAAYPGIFFWGGGGSNSVEDRENRDLGAVAP